MSREYGPSSRHLGYPVLRSMGTVLGKLPWAPLGWSMQPFPLPSGFEFFQRWGALLNPMKGNVYQQSYILETKLLPHQHTVSSLSHTDTDSPAPSPAHKCFPHPGLAKGTFREVVSGDGRHGMNYALCGESLHLFNFQTLAESAGGSPGCGGGSLRSSGFSRRQSFYSRSHTRRLAFSILLVLSGGTTSAPALRPTGLIEFLISLR